VEALLGGEIIPTRMDLKMKYDAHGSPTKHKGRLVVLGDQEWGGSLRDVFAPTVLSKTINILLSIWYLVPVFGSIPTWEIDRVVAAHLAKRLEFCMAASKLPRGTWLV